MFIIVYVVILVQSLSTFFLIFAISEYFNKTNLGYFKIKFTIIVDQIPDILINITGNQHKTIFLSVVESLDL